MDYQICHQLWLSVADLQSAKDLDWWLDAILAGVLFKLARVFRSWVWRHIVHHLQFKYLPIPHLGHGSTCPAWTQSAMAKSHWAKWELCIDQTIKDTSEHQHSKSIFIAALAYEEPRDRVTSNEIILERNWKNGSSSARHIERLLKDV